MTINRWCCYAQFSYNILWRHIVQKVSRRQIIWWYFIIHNVVKMLRYNFVNLVSHSHRTVGQAHWAWWNIGGCLHELASPAPTLATTAAAIIEAATFTEANVLQVQIVSTGKMGSIETMGSGLLPLFAFLLPEHLFLGECTILFNI